MIQNFSDWEMQGFVGETSQHESKRLYEKFASSVQTSYAWRSTSTITFQSFANGIKVSKRNAASEIYSEFIYLC